MYLCLLLFFSCYVNAGLVSLDMSGTFTFVEPNDLGVNLLDSVEFTVQYEDSAVSPIGLHVLPVDGLLATLSLDIPSFPLFTHEDDIAFNFDSKFDAKPVLDNLSKSFFDFAIGIRYNF